MNPDKIGKFISECRKKKSYTQEQLGEQLGITSKAVSKWECGKSIPDVSLWKNICELFEITQDELIAGEKINKKLPTETHDSLLVNLGYFIKKSKSQTKIFMFLSGVLLLIVVGLLILFYVNNYNNVKFFTIYGETEHYYINGFYKNLNDENIFIIYEIKPNEDDKEVYGLQCSLVKNDSTILFQKGNIYDFEYDKHSKKLSLNYEISNSAIIIKETADSEFIYFANTQNENIFLEIRYLDTNFEVIVDKIPLSFLKEFSNNKLYYPRKK